MRLISHSILCRTGIITAGLGLLSVVGANDGACGVLGAGDGVRNRAKLAMSFEPNLGQADPRVKFLARGPGYTLFLTGDGATLVMQERKVRNGKPADGRRQLPVSRRDGQRAMDFRPQASVIRLKFAGANPSPKVTGTRELPGKSNYFAGNTLGKWRTNVPTYARVNYADVYPGVDLVYYGNQKGELEYDFVVKPGADPNAITLAVVGEGAALPPTGARRAPLQITANGDLVVRSGGRRVRFKKPTVYQNARLIDGRYVLRPSSAGRKREKPEYEVGFAIAAYDHRELLVIDPVLNYAAYLGGSGFDYGYGIAVDSSGSAYVTGATSSPDFPLAGPAQQSPGNSGCADGEADASTCYDAFVTKLNPAGTAVVYSTYLGGSGQDYGMRIAVDANGNAYVTGYTTSTDFPVQNAIQTSNAGGYDAFVAELSVDGASLVYSTYWGGSGDDLGYGIAVDSSGNAYMAGATASPDFPVTSGAFQTSYGSGSHVGFVVKFGPGGAGPAYSTLFGGSSDDYAYGVAVDSSGDAYVTGATNSPDFPALDAFQPQYAGGLCGTAPNTFPCYDAFVAKLNPAGSGLVFSTFLGGTGSDYGYAIALDGSFDAYVTGYTTSKDLPTTTGAFQQSAGGSYDAFVVKLDSTGSALAYSTYLGGSGSDVAYDIGVDSSGRAFVTGYNYGGYFPTAYPLQAQNAGFYDVFFSVLDASGSSLVFSTYFGGSYDEVGRGIAVDGSGNGYVTGGTFSLNLPVTSGSFQTSFGGGSYDGFVAKFNPDPSPSLSVSPSPYDFGNQVIGTASSAESITLSNTGNADLSFSSISSSGDFAVSQSCPSTLSPGDSCVVSVTFTPSVVGNRTGGITITDNAPGSPQTVSLSGVGVLGYTLAANTNSVSVEPGTDSVTFTLATASQYGFSGNITLACSGNSPAACFFSPSVIAPGGSSTLTVSGLSGLGTDTFSFSVVGASGMQSVSTTLVILVGDFSISASPANVTVAAGGSASYTITVNPINGFDLPVSLACSGAPANATCSLSPALKPGTGSQTLMVQTTASSSATLRWPPPFESRKGNPILPFAAMALLSFVLAAAAKTPCDRCARTIPRFAFTLPLLLLCLACGGGAGGGSQTSGNSASGTPTGTYTLTVTATATPSTGTSSSISRSTTVTLTVD